MQRRDDRLYRRVDGKDLPPQEEGWKTLVDLHRINMFRDAPSTIEPSMPAKAPEDMEEFHKKAK